MSADLSTEPTMEEENFFSGLKKKKKSGTKKVLLDDEPTPAPPAPAAAAEDDEPAAEDEDNMFGDLKKKYVLSCRSWSGKSQCFWVGRTELGLTTMTSPFCVVLTTSSRKKKKAAPVDLLGNVSRFILCYITLLGASADFSELLLAFCPSLPCNP